MPVDLDYVLPGPLALARATVDRAAHYRNDPAWLAWAWSDPATRVVVVGESTVAVDADAKALSFVSPADAPEGERFFLGLDDGVAYLAVHTGEAPAHGATLREAGVYLDDRDAGLAVHSIALANWHTTHTHCPRCGAPTVIESGGHVRRCTADGSEHYPRTDPAVIMLVVDENERCLLGRGGSWPDRRYSTLAGFVEPGESPEHAVVREVLEESGIVVDSCRYAGAQPWPFPTSLMLGFYATARGDVPTPDGDEVVEARWFSREELETLTSAGEIGLPRGISIARKLVEGWYGRPLPAEATWH